MKKSTKKNKYSGITKSIVLVTIILYLLVTFFGSDSDNKGDTETTAPPSTTMEETKAPENITETIPETTPEEPEVTIMYTNEEVNVRSGPGSDYSKLATFPVNTLVFVYDASGEWAEIKYDSDIAYIYSSYLQDKRVTMVWIVDDGAKYHNNSSCSKMNDPHQVSIETAISQGYEPCKKCYR